MSQLNLESSLVYWPVLENIPKNQLSQIRSFMVIKGDNRNPIYALVITDDYKVLCIYEDWNWVTQIVEFGDGKKKIVQMCHGENHVLALTNDGQVLLWDYQLIDKLNINGIEMESFLPTVIDFGSEHQPIAMIKCGLEHSLAVTEGTGKVYAWENVYYNEDDEEFEEYQNGNLTIQVNPTIVSELEELVVVKVECGANHSMALTDNGLVYCWGDNESGQLGTGDFDEQSSPVKVTINIGDDQLKNIACGCQHSLLLTKKGIVYGCGQNDVGQLGIGENKVDQVNSCPKLQTLHSTFVKVNIKDVLFRSIYAVDNLSVAISTSGLCYVWGESDKIEYWEPFNTNLFSIDHVLGVYSMDAKINRLIPIANPVMSTLALTLCESFNDSISSDLKFVLNERSIHVHRLLLQISSPYYQRMLSNDWLKSDSVEINDYSYSVYYARLRYIYTGHFPQMDNLDEVIELFDLANCQLDYGLRDLCISYLTEMVSIDNCCHLFILSTDYKLDSLRQTIGKFISANLYNVIKSDSIEQLTGDQCRVVMVGLKHFIK